ncbi:uncharacterized protein LOC129766024 [Toxorhynchites rutilus septentrionalis]|uniref:uncharacterized protein LOC129766024 n=1 Tax=Toxorhynchites rutilus septentrionalis TaxID=329112 RepID=UPI002478D018|nr:uncharacterized protein LOC129766024 [Toxorhynchites rutilus septentrionalis]
MYLMLCVRPDVCFPVGYLGRFQQNPTTQHWRALKHVVRYVEGTRGMTLLFRREESSVPLVGYADADWASDVTDRKSVSGYLFKVFGCPVSWCSKKQQTVATSSSEAEYVALSLAATKAIWLNGVLEDLQEASAPVTIYEDNRGCICMAKNLEMKRTKHIEVKHHFLRDHVASGSLKIEPTKTEDQIADIFTKPLESTRFKVLRSNLGLTV